MTQIEEIRALDRQADRLRGRFPEAPPDGIRPQAHRQCEGRPIREFIPVLVEREVAEYFRAPEGRSSTS